MRKDLSKVYSEVDEILNYIDSEYVEKIPLKVRTFFKEEKNEKHIPIIDIEKPLEEQNLNRDTIVILAILNYNYWCESEEEKQEILKEWAENDSKYEAELREKYNPDNLFKKKENIEENIKETAIVEYKELNFIQKLLRKIQKFFRRE